MKESWVLGIDATNLLQGGGRTHLIELLRAAESARHGCSSVVVWGSPATLALLPDCPWLRKLSPPALSGNLFSRALWQSLHLDQAVRQEGCDLLFVPGGSYTGGFRPVMLMSQNLLPFAFRELLRYGYSWRAAKLFVLRQVQALSFQRSDGLIFLTQHARRCVQKVVARLPPSQVISHGLGSAFLRAPRPQKSIAAFSPDDPFRILYVSIVDAYKHQWHVVDAVARLRRLTGWPLALDLVGPAYPQALKRLQAVIASTDPEGRWLIYHGAIPYEQLHEVYANSHLGLWASSCETFGIILLEAMGAGLPMACSSHPPMQEILGDGGLYFDPEDSNAIATTLQQLIAQPELRDSLAQQSYTTAQTYTWSRTAADTFSFLADVLAQHRSTTLEPCPIS